MKRTVLGILFLFFLVTAGHSAQETGTELTDYKALAEQCKKASSVNCCMASVHAMEEGKYQLDTGKSTQETACPSGYQPDMMKCIDSYRWCVPVKPMAAEEPMDEDAVIKQAALDFFREHVTACAEGTVSVTIKEKIADRVKVSVRCDCGMGCMHFCSFEVEKKFGHWQVENQEMECAVS